ncbi:MAG: flagellar FliJ family protein [Firmicutes bacterium]|nr:flagellar FliJ family protein [Candidatus Fermentithermobacillaceae bacterium]
MKRFSFNLQKVADVRELRRRIAEEKLGLALGEKVRAEGELRRAISEEERVRKEIAGMTRGIVDTVLVTCAFRYRTRAEEELGRCRELVRQAEARLEAAREEALKRITEHEVMLRLRKRRFEAYMDAYWWEYSKTLDEIGLLGHVRRERFSLAGEDRASRHESWKEGR